MGKSNHFAVVGSFTLILAASACTPSPQYPPLPDSGPCVVDDDPDRGAVAEQALVYLPPAGIELFLDEDSGGPLRCRPTVASCAALADCVGAPVQLPIGVDATLAVGLRTVTDSYGGTILSVTFEEADPAFSILQPVPSQMPTGVGSETFAFIGVRPPEGTITARIAVSVEAINMSQEPVLITLQVEGVAAEP